MSKSDCGYDQLSNRLRTSALRGQIEDTGRTFVWTLDLGSDPDPSYESNEVLAYFTLSQHLLGAADLNLSRTKPRSLPDQEPAVLLVKLALDIRLRRKGLGGALLATVLTRCVAAGELAAARYVVTDAIDDRAMNFNLRYTFVLIPGTNRLVRPIKDIADELRRG